MGSIGSFLGLSLVLPRSCPGPAHVLPRPCLGPALVMLIAQNGRNIFGRNNYSSGVIWK